MSVYKHDEIIHNFKAAEKILPILIKEYKIKSILDVGTGIGTWLNIGERNGIDDYVGVDGNWVDKEMLKIPGSRFITHDLNNPLYLNRKFDLVICLEVAEHLPEKSSTTLVESLIRHGDLILFSSAIPFQGGQNHLNEQPPLYWKDLFNNFGYCYFDLLRPIFWNDPDIEWWYRQNIFLVSNKTIHPLPNHEEVNLYVHPELFYQEISAKERLKEELQAFKTGKKSTLLYLKLFIKSILKP